MQSRQNVLQKLKFTRSNPLMVYAQAVLIVAAFFTGIWWLLHGKGMPDFLR